MKTVFITGGATGIGRATAVAFAQAGWQVAFSYCKSGDDAAMLTGELAASGFPVSAFCCDVTDETQVMRTFEAILQQFGTVDAVVNNSGVALQTLFTDTTERQWDTLFNVNVKGAFLVSREAVRQMLQKHQGAIVNVSSMWGQTGASCEVAYSASKAALIGLTKALAKEVGLSGIRVNCICPGMIDTAMNRNVSEAGKRELQEETPLNRIGTPEEVANAILFLAGDASSFVTGQVLGVNGGLVI